MHESYLEIQKHFNKMYPSKRLFVCGKNDFIVKDEVFFIRTTHRGTGKRLTRAARDDSPGFIVHAPKEFGYIFKESG